MVNQILSLRLRKFEHFRHHNTFGWTGPNAERAITTLRHINIEPRNPQRFLFRKSSGHAQVFSGYRFHRIDFNAIDRTGTRAFIAANTIVHIDV